jgi:hypothetical protein
MGRVKVSILEENGTELTIGRESGFDDKLDCGGLYSESPITFDDSETTEVTLKELKDGAQAGASAIFPRILTYNGTVSNGYFYGYTEGTNGLDTPVQVPADATLKIFTFSNKRSNADYDLVFRKNSPTATPFLTISKTNTKNFVFDKNDDPAIEESFLQGELIYIENINTGSAPQDVGITLDFKADF